jgi:hypothetical protein
MKKIRWSDILTGIAIASFLGYKLIHLVFRFGDGSAYIYMAQAVLQGLLPYRDFFLADPPFLVLFLVPFKLLFGEHLLLFQALPIVLEAASALFLYLLVRGKLARFSWIAPVIYVSSFAVLAVSDYLTGIQLVIFLLVLGLWCQQKSHPIFAGIAWGLATLTKFYAIPVVLGFAGYLIIKNQWPVLRKIAIGIIASGIIIFGPFLLLAFQEVWKFTFVHQFNRPPGLARGAVWGFFLAKHWALAAFAVIGLFLGRQKHLYLPFFLILLFLLLFQDIYFVYLELLLPFLVLFAAETFEWLSEKISRGHPAALLLAVSFVFPVIYSSFEYVNDFQKRGRFLNARAVAAAVRKLPSGADLYGSHEVAPLLALLSGRKLFGNVIDTNPQAFASGGLNQEKISSEAVKQEIYLIGRITQWPEYGFGPTGFEGYFARDLFEKSCKPVQSFVSLSNEQDNKIAIYECYK